MKVYILTDLEGVSGVVNFDGYTMPAGKYYEKSRALLTQEINAAVEGALEVGFDDLVVWDGHGPGAVNFEELHPEAKLLFGKDVPRTLGLDETFDAMFAIGQHAMSKAPNANMCHSYSLNIDNMWLNGELIGELGMRAVLAGHFDVATVLVTGDIAACEEAEALVPVVETVAVKRATGFSSAICLHPKKVHQLIRQAAKRAMERASEIKPYKVDPPYELKIEYTTAELAETAGKRPGWERVDSMTAKIVSDDFLEIAM